MPEDTEPLTRTAHYVRTAHRWEYQPPCILGDQLKRCSPNYKIVEAPDAQSGLALYRSQRIDCVVTELALTDETGFEVLADLVPIANSPHVPVIVLTDIEYRGLWEEAKQQGAYACLHKHHTTGDDLNNAIQRAIEFVKQMPEEDRDGPS
jgi:DNA-binding NarL/FixJ family response regulator